MYRVRFHLANGPHFMHWQIKDLEAGNVEYVNPERYSLLMIDCQLKNKKNIAKKIFDGSDKDVCAWIECRSWHLQGNASMNDYMIDAKRINHIRYNPRKQPNWCLRNKDIDNYKFDELMTLRSQVYHLVN